LERLDKMVRFTSFALSFWAAQAAAVSTQTSVRSVIQTTSRELSAEKIAGYEPQSQVTDHNAIDKDQAAMQTALAKATPDYATAKAIYEQGGNSKSYAEIKLDSDLLSDLVVKNAEGVKTTVTGKDTSGKTVVGKLYKNAAKNQNIMKIQYATSDVQDTHVECSVGAMPGDAHVTGGCFAASGSVEIGGTSYPYSYNVHEDNKNGRTIQGFSTAVESKMITCDGCPFDDAQYFKDYYGVSDYADKWIQAVFSGAATSFTNGNADFEAYGNAGKIECIKKGTVYLNVFMYVIREFEDALVDCETDCDPSKSCNDDPVHAWDEGVAFYTGSLEGQDGSGSGKMLYDVADKRCANFKTCGADADSVEGTSHVNLKLFELFEKGKNLLLEGKCKEGVAPLKEITALMYTPLIQGTLRYAYKADKQKGGEKEKAEGAVFAASVLPRIHAEDPAAAKIIYENMKVGATSTDQAAVKKAFESVYSDLGISCEHVGGLYSTSDAGYYPGAEPCSKDRSGAVMKSGMVAATLGAIAMVFTSM